MAKLAAKEDTVEKLLKDLVLAVEQSTIVTLGLRGISQAKIRALVGGEMKRVSLILKHLKGHITL